LFSLPLLLLSVHTFKKKESGESESERSLSSFQRGMEKEEVGRIGGKRLDLALPSLAGVRGKMQMDLTNLKSAKKF
jgi:hypothetical protein